MCVDNYRARGRKKTEETWPQLATDLHALNEGLVQADPHTLKIEQSAETSAFMVDCLIQWWQQQRPHYPNIRALAPDLDGGSVARSNRTQFITPMAQSTQATGLRIHLIDYPPDHSQ